MTNLEFMRKATLEDIAKKMERHLYCDRCFLYNKCSVSKGCKQTIREWLQEEMGNC